jgi:hypothetical protein
VRVGEVGPDEIVLVMTFELLFLLLEEEPVLLPLLNGGSTVRGGDTYNSNRE